MHQLVIPHFSWIQFAPWVSNSPLLLFSSYAHKISTASFWIVAVIFLKHSFAFLSICLVRLALVKIFCECRFCQYMLWVSLLTKCPLSVPLFNMSCECHSYQCPVSVPLANMCCECRFCQYVLQVTILLICLVSVVLSDISSEFRSCQYMLWVSLFQ